MQDNSKDVSIFIVLMMVVGICISYHALSQWLFPTIFGPEATQTLKEDGLLIVGAIFAPFLVWYGRKPKVIEAVLEKPRLILIKGGRKD